MKRPLLVALACFGILPAPLAGQGIGVGAARWLTSPRVSEYRVGLDGFGFGPFSYRPTVQYLQRAGVSRAVWAGAGADLILRTTAAARPYLIGGAALGLGRADSVSGYGPGVGAWGGLGAELFAAGPLGLQAEALYTWRSRMGVSSISLGLRLGARVGRQIARKSVVTTPAELPKSSAADEETMRLATAAPAAEAALTPPAGMPAAGVVVTALSVMGTPYRWGGTSQDGFDCSGLIQFAYAQHGLTLPRRSVDQARAGSEIGRAMDQLMAGDILTFASEAGGAVTHVGLYVGNGRFIHSANGGVKVSVLAAGDPAGKWWFERWVGARRVLDR